MRKIPLVQMNRSTKVILIVPSYLPKGYRCEFVSFVHNLAQQWTNFILIPRLLTYLLPVFSLCECSVIERPQDPAQALPESNTSLKTQPLIFSDTCIVIHIVRRLHNTLNTNNPNRSMKSLWPARRSNARAMRKVYLSVGPLCFNKFEPQLGAELQLFLSCDIRSLLHLAH